MMKKGILHLIIISGALLNTLSSHAFAQNELNNNHSEATTLTTGNTNPITTDSAKIANQPITEDSNSKVEIKTPPKSNTDKKTEQAELFQQLIKMQQAAKSNNYESYFVVIEPVQVRSYRFRHANVDNQQFAQLLDLDGAPQEVLQRNDIISYFNPSHQPFSLQDNKIIDAFPGVLSADFNYLKQYYDFVSMGKGRVANRLANVIKLYPKDNFRYEYTLWLDSSSGLLLQSNLQDRDGNLLQQYRVVALYLNDKIEGLANLLNNLKLPPLLSNDSEPAKHSFNWNPVWLPLGFKKVSEHEYKSGTNTTQTIMYSDGLFDFSIYVTDNIQSSLPEHFWNQGGNTIYTQVKNGRELTLIGQLPLVTAKQIVHEIKFK